MPLQNLFLDADSLRIGANQFLTQANAVFVGNNLHVGNTILMGVTAGNTQWPVNFYPNSTKLLISANNPLWTGSGGGAIDLRVGTAGGRVGITFSSNTNFGSDGAYIYYNDTLTGYTSLPGGETSVFLLGTWNDASSSPANEDVIAIEGPGNIFLNPGMGTSVTPGGTTSWSNTQGNLWVGNNSIKYLAIHEGLQANVTLRAPITFANSANALVFSGASNTSITLRTSPNGILSFDGGAGSLLSISNNILGQIFSVNDISGFPVIEVTANTVPSNTFIQMGQFGAKVSIGTNATPNSTLTVTGNSTVTAIDIQNAASPQSLGYLRTPSGTKLTYASSNELVLMQLGQLRFTDGSSYSYDAWGGIKWVTANNTMIIGGPGAPGITNNTVVSANIVMHNATTGNFMIANSTATNLFVGANGNVGIGTTSPTEKLYISGSYIFQRNNADAAGGIVLDSGTSVTQFGQIIFRDQGTDKWYIRKTTSNNFDLYNSNTTSVALTISSANNNVGIGTTTPPSKFSVVSSVDGEVARFQRGGGTNLPILRINVNETTNITSIEATGAVAPVMNFLTGTSERMRIDTNGNVGIGNAAPNAKLQVTGTANISGNVALGGDLTVAGNLTISGTTTYINTTTLNIGDNIITLNADLGAVAPSENAGIEVNRGSSANVTFLWDETNDYWAQGNTNITGFANVSTSVNTALLTVGTAFIANTTGAYHTGTVNATSVTVGTAVIANSTGITTTGFVNATSSVNSAVISVGTAFIANTTGAYHTGTINAASHTISTGEFTANTIGITTTGFVNASSYAAACNQFVANSTGITTTGFANVGTTISIGANVIANTTALFVGNSTVNTVISSTTVNAASHTVGTSFIANTTGAYHTGTINATSVTVGTSFIANATGAFHTGRIKSESELSVGIDGFFISFFANSTGTTINGFANVTTSVNSALLTVGTNFIANSTGITTTGFANVSTTVSVGANVIANTTAVFVGNSTVNTVITQTTASFNANSSTTALFVAANGNIGIGNTTPAYPLSVTGAINANSYNVGGTAFINTDRTITYYGTTHNQLGSGSGTRDINLTLGNFISATVAGTTTWTFSNPIAGSAVTGFILELTNGGSAALTWPASVKWPGGTAPTLTAAGIDVLTFFTDDGGTTYRGVLSMLDSK